jgi:ribose 1,5-bisphosphokinase PhnN
MVVVLINGASASGKSRLIAGVERRAVESGVFKDLRVAKRTTTRAAREAESLPHENLFLDPEDFHAAAQSGALDVHWKREISSNHVNRYGFSIERELDQGGVILLSANNYLQWTRQASLLALRDVGRLMVVRVSASPETRLGRLRARRPRLSDLEVGARMADLPPHLLPPADHVVPNDPEFERVAEWQLLELIAAFRFSVNGAHGNAAGTVPVLTQ